jgi:hypothetical protein
MIGIGLAASGHFPYAEYASAMVCGNLNFAILMCNELFWPFIVFVREYSHRQGSHRISSAAISDLVLVV